MPHTFHTRQGTYCPKSMSVNALKNIDMVKVQNGPSIPKYPKGCRSCSRWSASFLFGTQLWQKISRLSASRALVRIEWCPVFEVKKVDRCPSQMLPWLSQTSHPTWSHTTIYLSIYLSIYIYTRVLFRVQLGSIRTLWKERTWKSIWTICGVPDAFGRTGPFCSAGALQSFSFNNHSGSRASFRDLSLMGELPPWKYWKTNGVALLTSHFQLVLRLPSCLWVACELTAAKDVKPRHLCPHGGPDAASDLAWWGPNRGDDGRPKSKLVILIDFFLGNFERTPWFVSSDTKQKTWCPRKHFEHSTWHREKSGCNGHQRGKFKPLRL